MLRPEDPDHLVDCSHDGTVPECVRAVEKERAAVVAWLREQRIYGTDALLGQGFATVCSILADEIERGEHCREEKE